MSKADFEKNHTDNGIIYHGTPQIDNILCIIRNGFVRSSAKQGTAGCGPGAYSTKDRATSANYGTPIEFKLKEEANPRILDWNVVQNDPRFKAVISSIDLEIAFTDLVTCVRQTRDCFYKWTRVLIDKTAKSNGV